MTFPTFPPNITHVGVSAVQPPALQYVFVGRPLYSFVGAEWMRHSRNQASVGPNGATLRYMADERALDRNRLGDMEVGVDSKVYVSPV